MAPSAALVPAIGSRRLPIGAEPQRDGTVLLRVWAPDHERVAVVMDGVASAMTREADGHFSVATAGRPGSRYGFRLGAAEQLLPDPASRAQPDGPHGLSQVVDPDAYRWQDDAWRGVELAGQVLYELHVGTFTADGTWAAAAAHLPELRDLGVTIVQMMPVAEFAGSFGWGYDGVDWFAPYHVYGTPDDLRAFVDRAHALGLGVVLDVVYNHLGPDGNHVCTFARSCVSERYANEWGEALNFDGPGSAGMRELVLANVEYWIREFHFDGFRFDATQQMFDCSDEHVLAAAARVARAAAAERGILLVGENEPQHAELVRPREAGGFGLDVLYNDDLHHAARVLLTGVDEAYYSDYRGSAHELLSAVRWGFLFQGQRSSWQKQARGRPALDLEPAKLLAFLENHDQIANSADGRRLASIAAPGVLRALTALLLLSPATPLLFQGQERGSENPFRYFADHHGELGDAVRTGRRAFLAQFVRYAQPEVAAQIEPSARATFAACVLDRTDTPRARRFLALHRDLLARRRDDPVLRAGRRPEGAALGERAFLLRWLTASGDDRMLLLNLGADLDVTSFAEPLLAPPRDRDWTLAWSSEAVAYGGAGTLPIAADRFVVPGQAAVLVVGAPRAVRARREAGA
jgi:maltooligosyltrehalose trehalohydrolase